jgi:hypothetical protein
MLGFFSAACTESARLATITTTRAALRRILVFTILSFLFVVWLQAAINIPNQLITDGSDGISDFTRQSIRMRSSFRFEELGTP